MGTWEDEFKSFLEDLKSQKGESGDNIRINEIHPIGRQGMWWKELDEAVEYVCSLNPKDMALRMTIRAHHPTGQAYIAVNAATQRFCFLTSDGKEASGYLPTVIRKSASTYNLREVDTLKKLYDGPTKNLLI